MTMLLIDPELTGDDLRQRLYDGNLVILTRLRALADFVDYTRGELTELFKPHDPEHVHEHIEPAEMATILGAWKPRFIHSEGSKKLVRAVIEEAGCQPEQTHYDVPKPRTSFPVGHLTTGVAFAFPWHRDVWYSAPAQQINWWLPIFPVREDNAMSFDLRSFARAVPNSSDSFDYYRNNASRLTTAKQVTKESQARPGAIDHHPDQELVVPAGARRGTAVLRRPTAYLHPQHLRPGPVQRRLPHRQRPRPAGRPRCPPGGRELHRYRHPGFHERRRRAPLRRADCRGPVRAPARRCHARFRCSRRRCSLHPFLTPRLAMKTFVTSNAYVSAAHELIPGGAHTYAKGDDQYPEGMAPVIERGAGCRVWDIDGNEYVEFGSGLRSNLLRSSCAPPMIRRPSGRPSMRSPI